MHRVECQEPRSNHWEEATREGLVGSPAGLNLQANDWENRRKPGSRH